MKRRKVGGVGPSKNAEGTEIHYETCIPMPWKVPHARHS